MQPQSNQDYKQLLTAVIKKQIVILGPDITLSKARNVKGLTVADDGTVTNVEGSPQEVTQSLIDQFVQLSGLIVKKTMEPLLSMSQPVAQQPTLPAETQVMQPVTATITQPPTPAATLTPEPTPAAQPTPPLTQPEPTPTPQVNPMPQPTPVQPEPVLPAEPPIMPPLPVTPQPEAQQPTPSPAPVTSAAQSKPANNPLAA